MKELKIPYLGVKIESLPTILNVLSSSKTNDDFVNYYVNLGKSPKTATEYLASLRNLKLAKKNNEGDTVLTSAGKYLSEDNIDNLYVGLLKHCLKNFDDLRIVNDVLNKEKISNLTELIELLEQRGFSIRRKQTLSSYYKLFFEAGKLIKRNRNLYFHRYKEEPIEYNQFLKILSKYQSNHLDQKLILAQVLEWIQEDHSLTREDYLKYLVTAKANGKIKLIEVNPKLLPNKDDVFVIQNRTYYYLEIQ